MGKSTPKPPDPQQTASAANSTNQTTAITNAYLGNINEVGPNGSTRIDATGNHRQYDPYTKVWSNVPTFARTTTLSPQQQRIAAQQNAASFKLASLGNRLSGTLGKQLTGNFKLDNPTVEGRLMELGRKRLDPMFSQQQNALDTKLANQGIDIGSEQWKTAQTQQGQNQNDAYNQLLLNGRGQATQELLTQDNQRINQISALLSGGQVSQPNFMGANMPTIPTTDVGGLINENYNQRLARANAKNQAISSTIGGLFGLGSSFLYR